MFAYSQSVYTSSTIIYTIKVMHYVCINTSFYRCMQFIYIIGVLGSWSSPIMNGSRPPPCSSFSLTVTDEDEFLMFGGITPSDKSFEAHVLYLPTMVSYYLVNFKLDHKVQST